MKRWEVLKIIKKNNQNRLKNNQTRKIFKISCITSYSIASVGLYASLVFLALEVKYDQELTPEIGYTFWMAAIGFILAGILVVFWEPKVRTKSDKLLSVGVFSPGIVLIILAVLNFLYGSCFYPGCDTQIEVIQFDSTPDLYHNQIPTANIIIKNSGEKIADNCVLRWWYTSLGEGFDSSNFSLNPNEIKQFDLQGNFGVAVASESFPKWTTYCETNSSYEGFSRIVVRCDNADTGLITNTMKISCLDK